MGKLVKNHGDFYFLSEDGTYSKVSEDISQIIEEEIKKRLDLELRLAKYNIEFDSTIQSKLITTATELSTAKKHLQTLNLIGAELIKSWVKSENIHGHMLSFKNQIKLNSKWLEDSKK